MLIIDADIIEDVCS